MTVKLSRCAIFTALTAVLSQITIPLQPVPINLALLSVYVCGALLGPKYGTFAIAAYVLAGAAGLPVFNVFTGGVGILVGKTGGYLIGYVAAALISGITAKYAAKAAKGRLKGIFAALGMTAGLLVCYALGTAWFIYVTKIGFLAALTYCVLPFLIGDALKITAAAMLYYKLDPVLNRRLNYVGK